MPQLDGLRAVAVASVVVYHWFEPPFALGQWGVTLFFVLSGYLITRNISELKAAGLPMATAARVFFVRRTLRLFPAYYLVVLLAALLYEDIRRDWAWYVGYVSNILMELRPHFGALKTSWSLSVEEQFYIVWFFAVMCLPPRRLPWIMALAFVVEPLARCTWLAPNHPMFRTWTLWANCDGLVLGVLLSRLETSGRDLPLSGAALAVIGVSFAGLPRSCRRSRRRTAPWRAFSCRPFAPASCGMRADRSAVLRVVCCHMSRWFIWVESATACTSAT